MKTNYLEKKKLKTIQKKLKERILAQLGDNLLTPKSILNPPPVPLGYNFVLVSSIDGSLLTNNVKNVHNGYITLDIFKKNIKGVMKKIYNPQRFITYEDLSYHKSFFSKKYLGQKCEKRIGRCEEKLIKSATETESLEVVIDYENGVWTRVFTQFGVNREEHIIYDKFGLEVYFLELEDGEVTQEYIRQGYDQLSSI